MMKYLAALLLFPLVLTISAQDAPKVTYVDGEGYRDCLVDGTPVWRHMNAYDDSDKDRLHDTYKTFHHVFANDGKSFITKGAGGRFTHHRGLFLGWAKTSTAGGAKGDWWHCRGVSLRHKEYKDGGQTVVNEWCDAKGSPIVRDTRTVKTSILEDGTRQMDFHIDIKSLDGDLHLNGDPQHAGFQFRAHNDVTKTHCVYVRPATAKNQGNDVWTDSPWMVGTFKQGEDSYSVQHMRHPDNPKFDEAVFSTRNYGRFGAYAPHKVAADETLTLKYRILVSQKAPTQEEAQTKYDRWTK